MELTGQRLFVLWRTFSQLDFLRQIRGRDIPDQSVNELINKVKNLDEVEVLPIDTEQLRETVIKLRK
ncbi:hypothetical protein GOP56_19345 [Brevibacillus sp. 7WMA2]|uniref:Uncharacterized protein n=2 Tax=Brevibacillus laterosporus TaxID=1465 RepID=A0A075R1D5_BRELA|nr:MULTISPECIES: hypothetical protein [Brevibacillus]HAS01940.1 hypothetical protein [Brevibacillus sp.]AIG25043.1 hypothetical protein BRLA_c006850 [Brevibacillus laterosporus LMG 15441]ATO50002.1 hypothetical protein BrL25_13440 [Brevibacillus laterosporus DSM 25]AUM63665.1 hypothetical protein C0R09_03495 [Brevibacillus laterosporus]AYB39799.1 hypothetical protein D5F52_16880 [Brevibacillus laterosporus]